MREQDLPFVSPLKLNMQMLADGFTERYYEPLFYNSRYDRQKLDYLQYYTGQSVLRENCVYLSTGNILQEKPIDNQDIALISIGDPGTRYRDSHNLILVFSEDIAVSAVLNIVNEIFERYHSFDIRLREALRSGKLDALSNLAVEFFHNPLQIHDDKFVLLSRPQYVSGMTEVEENKELGVAVFKNNLINQFKSDPEYMRTLSTKGAQLWVKHTRPYYTMHRTLYINIFDDAGRYRGRICLNELNTPFLPSHFRTLEFFAEFVRIFLTSPQNSSPQEYLSFENFLRKYLSDEEPSREKAIQMLSLYKWQVCDSYVSAKIKLTQRNLEINSVDHACLSLSLLFPSSRVFYDNGYIWLTENLSADRLLLNSFQTKLADYAKEDKLLVGQSSIFHNFFGISASYRQADIALSACNASQADYGYCSFPDTVNHFLLNRAMQQLSPHDICHEQLFCLQEHDREKGTDYYQTLRVYLEYERNLTLTAQKLHLHRSTLQYRIDRLNDLFHFDLDDPELRLYLLNCFRILDNKGQEERLTR